MRLHTPHRCMNPHRTRAGPGTRLSRAGPAGLLRARVGVEALELVGIDAAHDPRGEQALEEPADPPGPVPGGRDPDPGARALRRHRPRGYEPRAGDGLNDDPAWLRLGHLPPGFAPPA